MIDTAPHRARTLMASCSSLLIASAILLGATTAEANGRFPNAQQLRELGPGRLVVAGTYGLLVTTNAGKDFGYVCETELFGKTSEGSWIDPLLESLPDGTLVTGSQDLARRTSDLGCSFQPIWSLPHNPEFLPPQAGASGGRGSVIDVCPSYGTANGVLALTSARKEGGSIEAHQLFKSADGNAWTAIGKPIPVSSMSLVLTLDAAPSRPQRIYVSGTLMGVSVLAVTDDAGETWSYTNVPLADEDSVGGVYIGGVSPTDPERVYLRAQRTGLADDGGETWDDSLLVSEDGGKTIREVLRRKGSLMGFAISPDGKTVAAGFGDPMVAPYESAAEDLGIYGASSTDLTFTQGVKLPVSCLRWTSSALYVCARDDDPRGMIVSELPTFHLGVYRGAGLPANLADVTPLLKLKDVRGPLPWADKRVSTCAVEWVDGDPNNPDGGPVCGSFNACTEGGTTAPGTDALVCGASTTTGGASSGGGAGAGAGTSSGGSANGGSAPTGGSNTSGAGGSTTTNGGSNASGASTAGSGGSSSSSGCGCMLAKRPSAHGAFWLLALVLASAWRRRTRDTRKASFVRLR